MLKILKEHHDQIFIRLKSRFSLFQLLIFKFQFINLHTLSIALIICWMASSDCISSCKGSVFSSEEYNFSRKSLKIQSFSQEHKERKPTAIFHCTSLRHFRAPILADLVRAETEDAWRRTEKWATATSGEVTVIRKKEREISNLFESVTLLVCLRQSDECLQQFGNGSESNVQQTPLDEARVFQDFLHLQRRNEKEYEKLHLIDSYQHKILEKGLKRLGEKYKIETHILTLNEKI